MMFSYGALAYRNFKGNFKGKFNWKFNCKGKFNFKGKFNCNVFLFSAYRVTRSQVE